MSEQLLRPLLEKTMRPSVDKLSGLVDAQGKNGRPPVRVFDVVDRDLVGMQPQRVFERQLAFLCLSDATEQTEQQVLAMRLDEELARRCPMDCFYEYVTKADLNARMDMKLWLFDCGQSFAL